MEKNKNKINVLKALSSLIAFYFVIRGFSELLIGDFLKNSFVEYISLLFSLIYIYLIDIFKIKLNGKLKFTLINIDLNIIMLISAIAIAINIAIIFDIKSIESFAEVYLFLVLLESIVLLNMCRKLRVLTILPNIGEYIKWTRYSAYASLTLILYPLAMLLFGYSLFTLGKVFDTIEKIKIQKK